jgi:hypothetical protein
VASIGLPMLCGITSPLHVHLTLDSLASPPPEYPDTQHVITCLCTHRVRLTRFTLDSHQSIPTPNTLSLACVHAERRAAAADAELASADSMSEARALTAEKRAADAMTALTQASRSFLFMCVCMCLYSCVQVFGNLCSCVCLYVPVCVYVLATSLVPQRQM